MIIAKMVALFSLLLMFSMTVHAVFVLEERREKLRAFVMMLVSLFAIFTVVIGK